MNRLEKLYEKSKNFEYTYRQLLIKYIRKIKMKNRIKFKISKIICKKENDFINKCQCHESNIKN